MPLQSDAALYLFHEGTNSKSHEYFGAHPLPEGGWCFRVWAPHAKQVRLAGDFCGWTPDEMIPMTGQDGVWECVAENAEIFDNYKYYILPQSGDPLFKADPYAFHAATRPDTASKLFDPAGYRWRDDKWMAARAKTNVRERPINIYELHAGSWRRADDGAFLSYGMLADELIPYIKRMGYTHIELLPLTEYPFDGSWGYQSLGYFAPTSRYGTPHDFMEFVDRCHTAGIGVIMDWVPAHFPKDAHGLYEFDGDCCYEYQDPLKREHPDWGTRVFDYGRGEVLSFLLSSAQFWLERYHIDGLRVDAVASMLYLDYGKKEGAWRPNSEGGNANLEAIAFLKKLNQLTHRQNQGVMMIAEESTAWPLVTAPPEVGGLGFDFKWSMGWMNDSLRFMSLDPYFRGDNMNMMTFSLTYAFSENYILPLSHDEVVHGKASLLSKMPGAYDDKFANLRTYYAYMLAHPGKKLLFMGGEFGQFIEWNEAQELDWNLLAFDRHRQMQEFVAALNACYLAHSALHNPLPDWQGFEWIAADDTFNTVMSFALHSEKEDLVAVFNFSGKTLTDYEIGAPERGRWRPILDTDDIAFGGKSTAARTLTTHPKPLHGKAQCLRLDLPPLSARLYQRTRSKNKRG